MNIRSISMECTSGDGTELLISTEAQEEFVLLKFEIDKKVVYVAPDDVDAISAFIEREQLEHQAEFPHAYTDAEEPPE